MHPAVTKAGYDIERVRADFPILAQQVYGKPLVYLDNAASAQKPRAVLELLHHAYAAEYANVHRGLHYLANAATEAFEVARELTLTAGDAGALKMTVNGAPARPLGRTGDVVTVRITQANFKGFLAPR